MFTLLQLAVYYTETNIQATYGLQYLNNDIHLSLLSYPV